MQTDRYTREQKKIIRAMQEGAVLWVACGCPFLTDTRQTSRPTTTKANRKTFNSLVERGALKGLREDKSNGIAKTPYILTKKGIAIKCQR